MDNAEMAAAIRDLQQTQAAMAENNRSIWRRIDEQQRLTETVHSLAMSVNEQTTELRHMRGRQDEMARDLEDLRGKGGKRWDTIVTALITTVVGALGGAAIASLIK